MALALEAREQADAERDQQPYDVVLHQICEVHRVNTLGCGALLGHRLERHHRETPGERSEQ